MPMAGVISLMSQHDVCLLSAPKHRWIISYLCKAHCFKNDCGSRVCSSGLVVRVPLR